MRAQAIANLDTFGYPDPFSPPTVPGYTFRIQTVHELPIYQAPPRFNQTETAFLDARLYELVNHLKVEPAPNSQHNCGLVLGTGTLQRSNQSHLNQVDRSREEPSRGNVQTVQLH